MSVSSERINKLAKLVGATKYLEVGVSQGHTFLDVNIVHKDAVDVRYGFDTNEFETKNVRFFNCTSDVFFSKHASGEYDLIFLDGLHTFEQTYRDFVSSISFSHSKTIFIIDDTIPSDVFSAIRDPGRARFFRQKHSLTGQDWHGDVYKIIPLIHDFYPALDYRTTDGKANGQTIVTFRPRSDFATKYNNLEEISRMNYFDFCDFLDDDCGKLTKFDDILTWLSI